MRKYLTIFMLPALLLLTACPQFVGNVPTPETPRDHLVVMEYSYQAALKTIEGMVDNGTLKGEQAATAADLLGKASIAVKTARTAMSTGSGDTTAMFAAANKAIAELIAYLDKQKE